jgi:hypothetical protein
MKKKKIKLNLKKKKSIIVMLSIQKQKKERKNDKLTFNAKRNEINISFLNKPENFSVPFHFLKKKKKCLLLLFPKTLQTKSQTTSMFLAKIH